MQASAGGEVSTFSVQRLLLYMEGMLCNRFLASYLPKLPSTKACHMQGQNVIHSAASQTAAKQVELEEEAVRQRSMRRPPVVSIPHPPKHSGFYHLRRISLQCQHIVNTPVAHGADLHVQDKQVLPTVSPTAKPYCKLSMYVGTNTV